MTTNPSSPPARVRRGHVLVVEDDAATARYLVLALQRAGYTAASVGDAVAAERYLADNDCDALLVDIGLPGPSGFELVRELKKIVDEELEHFTMVLDLLERRGIRFRRLKPSEYGRKLNDLVRKQEPYKAVDRLLVAALIEARSCERFSILRDGIDDAELADFYGSLFESEARHHATYVRFAREFADEHVVRSRLEELAQAEAEILSTVSPVPRMHS